MKRFAIFCLLVAATLFASCKKEISDNNSIVSDTETYTFQIAANAAGIETKTFYGDPENADDSVTFYWSDEDQISVLFHNGDVNEFFPLTNISGAGTEAIFSGSIKAGYELGSSDSKLWALFPASDSHTYTEGSAPSFYIPAETDFTAEGAHYSANLPMYAYLEEYSEESSLAFHYLASAFRFTVSDLEVSKIRFSVSNNVTYALSGSFGLGKESSNVYLPGVYASVGSEAGAISFVENVSDGKAVFYVSTRYNEASFKPSITITDYETGYILKELTASNAASVNAKGKIQPVTISAPGTGTAPFVPAITIDNSISDWADIPHTFTPASHSDEIAEWKYTKDSRNIYILYKIPTSKMSDGNYIYVGVDADNNTETGGSGDGHLGAGLEYYRYFFPWKDDGGVKNRIGAPGSSSASFSYNSGSKAWQAAESTITVGGTTIGTYNYVEVQIPLSEIGSPEAQIRITHSFGWDNIGSTLIMPETAIVTVTASDNETVGIGKTLSLGASTYSSATISYSSSNTSVATVDDNGIVTGIATGTATITASVAAVSGEYTAASKSINVSVPLIMIDGNMSDWSEISGTSYSNYTSFKVASDEWNLYFYAYRSASTSKYWEIWGGVGYIYVGLDTDNNASTPAWDGADENNPYKFWGKGPYEYIAFIYPYGGTPGTSANSYQDAEPAIATSFGGSAKPSPYTTANVSCSGAIDASGVAVEFSIPRTDLPTIPNTSITVKSWGNKDLSEVTISCTL